MATGAASTAALWVFVAGLVLLEGFLGGPVSGPPPLAAVVFGGIAFATVFLGPTFPGLAAVAAFHLASAPDAKTAPEGTFGDPEPSLAMAF